jgi:MFS family permease
MRAELVLMGRRVDMALQARRRGLVVAIYAVMTGLLLGMWFVDHFEHTWVWVYLCVILLGRLFLGGYSRGGLVKPFNDKPPRRNAEPPPFLAVGLRVYNPLPEDDRSYLNDERELAQRDHAHYLAYQAVAVSLVVLWLLSGFVDNPKWAATFGASLHQLLYGLIGASLLLAFTLPQAILLWTEPDMEGD